MQYKEAIKDYNKAIECKPPVFGSLLQSWKCKILSQTIQRSHERLQPSNWCYFFPLDAASYNQGDSKAFFVQYNEAIKDYKNFKEISWITNTNSISFTLLVLMS